MGDGEKLLTYLNSALKALLGFDIFPRVPKKIIIIIIFLSFFFWSNSPQVQAHLIHEVCRSHTTTHHTRWNSSGRVISSSQRPVPDNTQHSQQTAIHAPGGIRTHNLNRRTAADLRLRPLGHWDRLFICYRNLIAARKLRH